MLVRRKGVSVEGRSRDLNGTYTMDHGIGSVMFHLPDMPGQPYQDEVAVKNWTASARAAGVEVSILLFDQRVLLEASGKVESMATGMTMVMDVSGATFKIINDMTTSVRTWLLQIITELHPNFYHSKPVSKLSSVMGLITPFRMMEVVAGIIEDQGRAFAGGVDIHSHIEWIFLNESGEMDKQVIIRVPYFTELEYQNRIHRFRENVESLM